MNKRHQDFELLQRFSRHGEQNAFADVVQRHLDLVFATALRKVADPGAAQEVAQNVFTDLARKAWRFAPDDSLPAWLHKAALLESKAWLRGELGRRRREETAAELGTTMKTPEDHPAFNALLPLLDEALLSLRETDRTTLLLRYYERQSLRDVGAAFGVSEDTAQKRVQSALEKLSEFFARRGFKTGTVTATAAALQYTAVSTSTAMVSSVVGAALQVAPPALVGLGAWLARLTSLSKVQTAAVCVTLAAVPVGWQLNERHTASEEAKRIQTQLLAAQNDGSTLQTEMEGLRSSFEKLEQSVAQANESAARTAESAQAFDVWKKKNRGLLTAADYRWPDDSPFVRIPKSALPELSKISGSEAEPFHPPGVVRSYARELMGMTPLERQSVEETLHRHFADVEERLAAGIQETNQPLSGRVVANKVFIASELDDEAKQRADRMLAEVRGILGEERWALVQARLENRSSKTLDSILNQTKQELLVWVETDDKGAPTMGFTLSGAVTTSQRGTLSMFLPEGDPNRADGAQRFCEGLLSNALRQRALAWLQEQASARLGKGAKR